MSNSFENIVPTIGPVIATIVPAIVSAVTGGTVAWLLSRKNQREPITRPGVGLKLEAQKISAFTGDYGDWSKWKIRTECTFDDSGYEKVLDKASIAVANPWLNKVVYSQLSVATVDSNSHHLVKKHEKTKDGYACWQSLVTWYDGDTIKNETSEDIRAKIDNLNLHSGTTASNYVNKFLTYCREL
jgi:hypothetical protein